MKVKKKCAKIFSKFAPSNSYRIFLLRIAGYSIGKNVYIGEDFIVSDELSVSGNVIIGDRVSIAPRVTIITSSSPNNSKLAKKFPLVRGKVIIREDAWIGAGVIILPNITVGSNSVIAAGAVVTKDVPPNTIVGGVPAKIIKRLTFEG